MTVPGAEHVIAPSGTLEIRLFLITLCFKIAVPLLNTRTMPERSEILSEIVVFMISIVWLSDITMSDVSIDAIFLRKIQFRMKEVGSYF